MHGTLKGRGASLQSLLNFWQRKIVRSIRGRGLRGGGKKRERAGSLMINNKDKCDISSFQPERFTGEFLANHYTNVAQDYF